MDVDRSPVPPPPDDEDGESRTVIGQCRKCQSDVGEFFNSWIKVTGSYYLPAMAGSYRIPGLVFGKTRPASADSALADCQVQPLHCASRECGENVGLFCVRAPEAKRTYVDRHLFKLSKIQLKSDITGEDVKATIEDRHHDRASSKEASVPAAGTSMESLDDAAKSSKRRENGFASPVASQGAPQKSIVMERQTSAGAVIKHAGARPPKTIHVNGTGRHNPPSPYGPNMNEGKLEALDRVQTQVNLNRASVENQGRDIRSLSDAFVMLQGDVRRIADAVEAMRTQVVNRPGPQGEQLDETLELFSSQLQAAIRKANEVDELKVQIEMLKRRIGRGPTVETTSPVTAQPYSAHHEAPAHLSITPSVPHVGIPHPPQPHPQPQHHQQAHQPPHQHPQPQPHPHPHPSGPVPPYASEVAHPTGVEPSSSGVGWVSVNPTMKRAYPNSIDSRGEMVDTPLDSPKRQKLTPNDAPEVVPIRYDHMATDEPPYAPPQPRSGSHEPYPTTTTSSTFVPYPNTQQPDENWRPESQRVVSNPVPDTHRSPRGRPRGRGGRPRKSLPMDGHNLGTPEWEKERWAGSQVTPDGYHPGTSPGPRRGGLVRRASGGTSGDRVAIPPPPVSSISSMHVVDHYAHTKKTRTKPVRNADGILIRKDGRPDMRSQSSAANLRKVHARKEEEKRLEAEAAQAAARAATTESSPVTPASNDTENMPNTAERTAQIMHKMFPHGVNEQREKLATTEDYFPSGKNSPTGTKSAATKSDYNDSRGASEEQQDEPMTDASTEQKNHTPASVEAAS